MKARTRRFNAAEMGPLEDLSWANCTVATTIQDSLLARSAKDGLARGAFSAPSNPHTA